MNGNYDATGGISTARILVQKSAADRPSPPLNPSPRPRMEFQSRGAGRQNPHEGRDWGCCPKLSPTPCTPDRTIAMCGHAESTWWSWRLPGRRCRSRRCRPSSSSSPRRQGHTSGWTLTTPSCPCRCSSTRRRKSGPCVSHHSHENPEPCTSNKNPEPYMSCNKPK